MRDTEGEAETQAERKAGSLWGARWGTQSQDPGVTPWAEGKPQPLSHLGVPKIFFLMSATGKHIGFPE